MPANPMQKKVRNAFILGVLITLIIFLVIGGLCYYFLVFQKNKEKEKEGDIPTYVYVLKSDVKVLQQITSADVEAVEISKKGVPVDAFQSKVKNSKGDMVDQPFPGLYYAKVSMKAGTILGSSLVVTKDESYVNVNKEGVVTGYKDDVRRVEYNMLTLGTSIHLGSYVDVRITFPNGQDMVVVSKKEVKSLLGNTVGFDLSEGEIELMQSAVVESYIIKASKIYVTEYIDPVNQKTIQKAYVPTDAVLDLMNKNESIVSEAFAVRDDDARVYIEGAKGEYATTQQQNIEEGIQEEIKNAQKAREAYLSGLTTY